MWFFFSEPVSAADARRLGSGLLTKTMACRYELSFASYDRLFPSQDIIPKGGFWNLIALPFQGQAQKNGNNYIKFVSLETAVHMVQSGDWVDYGFGAGFPELLDRALATRKGQIKDVKIRGGLVIRSRIEVVESDPGQESFSFYN